MLKNRDELKKAIRSYKREFIRVFSKSALLAYSAPIFLLNTAVNLLNRFVSYILPLRWKTALKQKFSLFLGSSNVFVSIVTKVCLFPRDVLVAAHQRSLGFYWRHLLQRIHVGSSSSIDLFEIQCLLFLHRDLVNTPVTIDGSHVRLLDLVICKSPTRFDVIQFLIKNDAIFDELDYLEFMHENCDFIKWRFYRDDNPYRSNSIYYLSEAVRKLSLDQNNTKAFESAKIQFKEIINYIVNLDRPNKDKGTLNYHLGHNISILAYMPTADMVQELVNKGLDPALPNPKLKNQNVLETLFMSGEYKRLELFLTMNFTALPKLKQQLVNAKYKDFNATCFALLHPILSKQWTDLEKIQLIAVHFHKIDRNWHNPFLVYGFNYLTNGSQVEVHLLSLITPFIVEWSKKSIEIYKIVVKMHLYSIKYREDIKKVDDYWRQQIPGFDHTTLNIDLHQCLPDGYLPKFDIKSLDENRLSSGQLIANARKVLNVNERSTRKDILHAYHALSLRHHPDRNRENPHANDEMSCINRAKALLIG